LPLGINMQPSFATAVAKSVPGIVATLRL
jgi:hypothetical protein